MLRRGILALAAFFLLLPSLAQADRAAHLRALAALRPARGHLLHGAYPGGQSGEEDDLTPGDVSALERLMGARLGWVYFSNNWYRDRVFPTATARWIRAHGATPFVRLMMRSDDREDHAEPLFALSAIAAGRFDADLHRWARAAARFKAPILAEFGTEMNGRWFPWNAIWNHRRQGPAQFRAAYRHIIDIARAEHADNIVWVFHVNHADDPAKSWNRFENYYPGDGYIDWLGVSIYGMLGPREDERTDFPTAFARAYGRLNRMAPAKPVIVAEFGTDLHNSHENAARWAKAALQTLQSQRWPALIGYAWWNERWPNDDTPAHDTDLRLQADPALAAVFRRHLHR